MYAFAELYTGNQAPGHHTTESLENPIESNNLTRKNRKYEMAKYNTGSLYA